MVKILLGVLLMLPVETGPETFTVSGTVTLEGPVPAARPNKKLEGDPACCALHKQLPPVDALVLDPAGRVCWTFVYVKKGLGGKEFEAPKAPITVEQQGCVYAPHVVGAQAGQLVNFRNTDPLLHNVHGLPFANKEFNFGQAQGAASGVKFTLPEIPVRVKCDVHPWMATFICVVDHPFFAVTDAAGRFEIKNLPPGAYTLGLWHEGVQTLDGKNEMEITVKSNSTANFPVKKK